VSNLYNERPFVYPSIPTVDTETTINGDAWQANATETGFIVDYISGELAGRAKQLAITGEEFSQLRIGAIKFDDLLIKYGVN
jgi:hypothetical protein